MHANNKQLQYYEVSFALFGKLNSGRAEFDDVVTCVERGVRLERALRKSLRGIYSDSVAGKGTWNELLDTAQNLFKKEPHFLINLLSNFFRVALLEQPLERRDDALIRIACERFSFPPQAYKKMRLEFDPSFVQPEVSKERKPRELSKPCREALEFLGCSPSNSISEIKTSYRQLARLYHPDMHSSEKDIGNLGEEMRQGFLSLQKAYEVVKREYKFD